MLLVRTGDATTRRVHGGDDMPQSARALAWAEGGRQQELFVPLSAVAGLGTGTTGF